MVITGTISEWEEWTGMRFPESDAYVVPGALQPVVMDLERDLGIYDRAERLDAASRRGGRADAEGREGYAAGRRAGRSGALWRFWNDLEVELAGGGDPPLPSPSNGCGPGSIGRPARRVLRDKTDFTIEADGACIGHCGLFHFDVASRHCELGIAIGEKEYWGRGYGREAVRLLLDYAFRVRNFRRVWLETHAANERAIRAYRACGFVEEGRMREHIWLAGRYVDNVIMGVMREEWQ